MLSFLKTSRVLASVFITGIAVVALISWVSLSVSAVEVDTEDCEQRSLGLYCPDDPSPVVNPNLDCPEREFGLYCPDDPSPVENPNQDSSSSSSDGGGGGGSSDPEPQPEPKKPGRVKGASTVCTRAGDVNTLGYIQNLHTPAAVERIFGDVFGRHITPAESAYWKKRVRCDKATEEKLYGAMEWHKLHGSTGVVAKSLSNANEKVSISELNSVFRSVYGRNPSVSEWHYWAGRLSDKPQRNALWGAMMYHKLHNIGH